MSSFNPLEKDLLNACAKGDIVLVGQLLDQGANIHYKDNKDIYANSPIIVASEYGHVNVVELLLSRGANINDKNKIGYSPIITACRERHVNVIELLLSRGANPNDKSTNGTSPIILASEYGNPNVVEMLLSKGADPNDKNDRGDSPIILASDYGYVEVVELLLSKGANINATNTDGMSSLMVACKYRAYRPNNKVVERLVREPGIDLFKTVKGQSALGFAIESRIVQEFNEDYAIQRPPINNSIAAVNNIAAILIEIDNKVFNHSPMKRFIDSSSSSSSSSSSESELFETPDAIIELTNKQLFESEEFNNLPKLERDLIKNIIQSKYLVLCLFKMFEHKLIFINPESITELAQTLLIELPEPVKDLPPDFVDAIRKKVFTILEENANVATEKHFLNLLNKKTKGGKRMKTRKNKKNKRNKQKMTKHSYKKYKS